MNPFLRRKKRSKIEADIEIVEFLSLIERYYTVKDLLKIMRKRFGSKRTPSKSALYRYIKKITTQTGGNHE